MHIQSTIYLAKCCIKGIVLFSHKISLKIHFQFGAVIKKIIHKQGLWLYTVVPFPKAATCFNPPALQQ
jgi:hypothetical protein